MAGVPDDYEDGCSYRRFDDRFLHCTTCPMVACRYDLPPRTGLLLALLVATARLVREGEELAAIARRLDVEVGLVARIARVLLAATGDVAGAVAGLATRDKRDSFRSTDTRTLAHLIEHPGVQAALRAG